MNYHVLYVMHDGVNKGLLAQFQMKSDAVIFIEAVSEYYDVTEYLIVDTWTKEETRIRQTRGILWYGGSKAVEAENNRGE
jgi:hypothetical protein